MMSAFVVYTTAQYVRCNIKPLKEYFELMLAQGIRLESAWRWWYDVFIVCAVEPKEKGEKIWAADNSIGEKEYQKKGKS